MQLCVASDANCGACLQVLNVASGESECGVKPFKSAAGSLPSWANPKYNYEWVREYNRDISAVRSANAKCQRFDLLWYGDSITAFSKPLSLRTVRGTRDLWEKYFGKWLAEPLAIPGDKIGNLAWRVMAGQEKPVLDPKVVVILIGYNDIAHRIPDPADRMDYLLAWFKKSMPKSKFVVMALLRGSQRASQLNYAYRSLAKKHRMVFCTCGQNIRPADKRYLADSVHPNYAGQDLILSCMKRVVAPLIEES